MVYSQLIAYQLYNNLRLKYELKQPFDPLVESLTASKSRWNDTNPSALHLPYISEMFKPVRENASCASAWCVGATWEMVLKNVLTPAKPEGLCDMNLRSHGYSSRSTPSASSRGMRRNPAFLRATSVSCHSGKTPLERYAGFLRNWPSWYSRHIAEGR